MTRQLPPWSHQIKTLRRNRNLTQKHLAEQLGVARKIVADWEQGIQEPSPRRYIQLAKMAPKEQALWFLERIGLSSGFLKHLAAASTKD